ncbi:hypothetical protein [Actinacidiphila sp. ITFR-21]|uniref:hypothetical protein n=1 Tax=Actinacidiphila sp. ITFR-21 TaxID=3075199 RepID=UPI0028890613|nr:hypothetical protein [Streptomyces sp. ITFR-21]WNI19411.1 hypothetical protein RLT57_30280 [Streptomyces sp. ITFR-21]
MTGAPPRAAEPGSVPAPAAGRPAAPPAAVPGTAPRLLAEGRWTAEEGPPPGVAGFVVSEFSPAIAAAADRCLRRHYGEPPGSAADTVAVLLISAEGDTGTAKAVADALDGGRRVQPLLFFQSNPNAVLGHISSRWNLTGPVVALGAGHGGPAEEVALLLEDGDADLVLVLSARPGSVTAGLYAARSP